MSEIAVKTENVIAVVTQAKTALESGDVSTGYRLFGEAKRNAVSIMKETEYLLQRVNAVEKHYEDLEEAKLRKIGKLDKKETETQKKKETKLTSMRSKELELKQAQMELASANENLSRAKRYRDQAKSKKGAYIAGLLRFKPRPAMPTVAMGWATPTPPIVAHWATPVAVVGAVGHTDNPSSDQDKAEKDIDHAKNKIRKFEGEISQYRREICQLDDEISVLSQQIRQMKSEQEMIHTVRGKVSDTIKYLCDVLYFWKEFGQLTEHRIDHATFLQKLSEYLRIHRQLTAKVSHQVKSCISSWERVERKLEEANEHIFSIDFKCQFCHSSFHSLPHLRDGKLCCIGCFKN